MTDNPHYVTPEEAENKICVQSMQIVMPMDSEAASCAGPKCMAWRWHWDKSRSIFWVANKVNPVPQPHWIRTGDLYSKEFLDGRDSGTFIEGPTKGYCGMVGP